MDQVKTPFVVNCFYFCDPDGHTEYVRTKDKLPVDDRTPQIKSLIFKDIKAENCHVAAAYFYGLPEQKIEKIVMENIHITYAENPQKDVPAMLEGIQPMAGRGIIAKNIEELAVHNIQIENPEGPSVELEGVDRTV